MDDLQRLLGLAPVYADELRQHEVLGQYWDCLSLILKGSVARGYADGYSDLDYVFFTDKETYGRIIEGYVEKGLSKRRDGVFFPLGDWVGHYNGSTYEQLESYFDEDDVANIWEYTNVRVMHDPQGMYARILEKKGAGFRSRLDSLVRGQYLRIQLELDWMRQPLRRADGAALLYGASFWRECCRLLYLLNGRPYPCDKWLYYYLDSLPAYRELIGPLKAYGKSFFSLSALAGGRELEEYPLYAQGALLANALADALRSVYGDEEWITDWYLYA